MRRVTKLAEPSRVRVGTWNVGSLMGKLREVVDTMIRRRVNILCVQEMKWKGQNTKLSKLITLVLDNTLCST